MIEQYTYLNETHLRNKGLSDKGIADARKMLLELSNSVTRKLEETQAGSENVILMEKSGGFELHKTLETLILGSKKGV